MSEWRMRVAPVGDCEIHYIDEGAGFPILLIHGLAGDHTAWNPQIEAWRGRHRVLATDTRGAGRSTQVDEPVTIRELALDLLAVLDHAGIEKCHLIGRSMGGFLAQHIALDAPERVCSLVMLASAGKLDPLAARLLTNMREVLEWTGSWPAHAAHSVPNFVSQRFFIEKPRPHPGDRNADRRGATPAGLLRPAKIMPAWRTTRSTGCTSWTVPCC